MGSGSAERTGSVRLVHLSDIHVSSRPLGWRPRDFFSKRVTGWVNWNVLGRGRTFACAETILAALFQDLRDRTPDHLVFSGDATALGFTSELEHAARLLRVDKADGLPGLAVPGNHDYYTPAAADSGEFERVFSSWQLGERVDGATYPFAQRIGHIWLIGVNSCTGNRWVTDAAGGVGPEQLERLGRLMQRLDDRPRILVTHYPICLASGELERRNHGLRDMVEVVQIAAKGGVGLWLHGHRHTAFHHTTCPQAPFPVICAGAATQSGRWSYGDYRIQGRRMHVCRRSYSLDTGRFHDAEVFDLELP